MSLSLASRIAVPRWVIRAAVRTIDERKSILDTSHNIWLATKFLRHHSDRSSHGATSVPGPIGDMVESRHWLDDEEDILAPATLSQRLYQ
jgi:hypothetical protein